MIYLKRFNENKEILYSEVDKKDFYSEILNKIPTKAVEYFDNIKYDYTINHLHGNKTKGEIVLKIQNKKIVLKKLNWKQDYYYSEVYTIIYGTDDYYYVKLDEHGEKTLYYKCDELIGLKQYLEDNVLYTDTYLTVHRL